MGTPIQPPTPIEPPNPLEDIVEEPKWTPSEEEIANERDRGRSVPSPIRRPLAAMMAGHKVTRQQLIVSQCIKVKPEDINIFQHVFMAPVIGKISRFRIHASQATTMKMRIISGDREIVNPYPLAYGPNSFPWTADMSEFERLEISCPSENVICVGFIFGKSESTNG